MTTIDEGVVADEAVADEVPTSVSRPNVADPVSTGTAGEPGAIAVSLTAVAAAAVFSAGAGLVHSAAAGAHQGTDSAVVVFALCAIAQLGWAGLAVTWPRRSVLALGAFINGGAVAAWIGSRTTGLPVVDAFSERQSVGAQDLPAAILGGLAVLAALVALGRLGLPAALNKGAVGFAAMASMALAFPALIADHDGSHGDTENTAAAGHDHAEGETTVAAGTGEDAAAAEGEDHPHTVDEASTVAPSQDEPSVAQEGSTDPEAVAPTGADLDSSGSDADADASTGTGHGAIPERLDHDPTDQQLEAAQELIDGTNAATAKYTDVEAAIADGYYSIGDEVTGVAHYVHTEFRGDGIELDPNRIESLVYAQNPDGSQTLITAMYILNEGTALGQVPDIAGNLTVWHNHENLCFDPATGRLSGVVANDGTCPAGVNVVTAPMLHVWVTDNPCGPFAGVDTSQMTGSCFDPAEAGL